MRDDIKNNKTITPTVVNEKFMFQKYHGEMIPDVIEYLKSYLYEHKHYELEMWVGCDSIKTVGGNATYVIAVCVYRKGKGAHIIHAKSKQKVSSVYDKLWKETELSISFTEFLKENKFLTIADGDSYNTVNVNGKRVPYKIDLDYNTKEDVLSSYLLQSGLGYCEQAQVLSRAKPFAWAASYFADHICRGKNLTNGNDKNKSKKLTAKKVKKMKYKEQTMTLIKGKQAI